MLCRSLDFGIEALNELVFVKVGQTKEVFAVIIIASYLKKLVKVGCLRFKIQGLILGNCFYLKPNYFGSALRTSCIIK